MRSIHLYRLCLSYPLQGPSGDAQDPHKSLDWYKRTLGTQLPNATVYQVLCRFYDDLDRAGVRHG